MAKGISLNIGLNSVDPDHYGGWDGQLGGCEKDANDMADIASASKLDVTKLLTKDATVENLKKKLKIAADELESNDYFFLSYSGHGGQIEDKNNDEDDFLDETWCLYDRQFVDDELNLCLGEFKDQVRIFVLSDSCHSGTVVKGEAIRDILGIDIDKFRSNTDKAGTKYRFAPDNVLLGTYEQNKLQYDEILEDINNREKAPKASILLISGCQDNELSADGPYNGYFTSNLKRVWNNGGFDGSYIKFHKQINNAMMKSKQHPKYFKDGTQNLSFESGKPFSI